MNTNFFDFPLFTILTSSCSNQNNDNIDTYLGFHISKDMIDIYLQEKMEEFNISGMSIAIINDGEIVHNNIFGYANQELKLPVTDKTIFEGASISKSVFSFFVMTFVEGSKLNLDKPLYEYFPHPDITDDEQYKKITARMVLSHQSGFPSWRKNEDDKNLKTKFEPGTDYLYSGEGVHVLHFSYYL